jgi:hypothetical protein
MLRRPPFASLAGTTASALQFDLVPAQGCTLLGRMSSYAMLLRLTSGLSACGLRPAGHYKYPPAEIPALLIQSGANLEAKDSNGRTALQVHSKPGSLLWCSTSTVLICCVGV